MILRPLKEANGRLSSYGETITLYLQHGYRTPSLSQRGLPRMQFLSRKDSGLFKFVTKITNQVARHRTRDQGISTLNPFELRPTAQ